MSWNGGGFDLPVLTHRALIHGVVAEKFWDWGDQDRDFKWNSYLGRYHTRHLDLMDVLAMYQPRASAGLDAMARLCGFPGKLGMDGSEVAAAVARGELADVRNYCETDVLNTYLVYQRFRLMRGELAAGEYAKEIALVREKIDAHGPAALEGVHRGVGRGGAALAAGGLLRALSDGRCRLGKARIAESTSCVPPHPSPLPLRGEGASSALRRSALPPSLSPEGRGLG